MADLQRFRPSPRVATGVSASRSRRGGSTDLRRRQRQGPLKAPFPQTPEIALVGRRRGPDDSTDVENPVDNRRLLPANTLFTTAPGAAGALLYSHPPMESFLDRLLAQDAGSPPAAATADRRWRPRSDGARRERGARRRAAGIRAAGAEPTSAADAPLGPGAPRIAIYDTLTSPPRVIERRGARRARPHRLARREDLPLLPRAGRQRAVHGHQRAHREPHPRLLPRRRHHHPRRRPGGPHLRPRPGRRRQGPGLPARLHHGDRATSGASSAAWAPGCRSPASRSPSCAARSRSRTTSAAARCSPSRCRSRPRPEPSRRAARPRRRSSRPARRRSSCCSWS